MLRITCSEGKSNIVMGLLFKTYTEAYCYVSALHLYLDQNITHDLKNDFLPYQMRKLAVESCSKFQPHFSNALNRNLQEGLFCGTALFVECFPKGDSPDITSKSILMVGENLNFPLRLGFQQLNQFYPGAPCYPLGLHSKTSHG